MQSELPLIRLTTPGKNYKLFAVPEDSRRGARRKTKPKKSRGGRHLRHTGVAHEACFFALARTVQYSVSSAASNPQANRGSVRVRDGRPSPRASHLPKKASRHRSVIGQNDPSPGSRPRERFPPSPGPLRQHVRNPVREHPSPAAAFIQGGGSSFPGVGSQQSGLSKDIVWFLTPDP